AGREQQLREMVGRAAVHDLVVGAHDAIGEEQHDASPKDQRNKDKESRFRLVETHARPNQNQLPAFSHMAPYTRLIALSRLAATTVNSQAARDNFPASPQCSQWNHGRSGRPSFVKL